MKATTVEEIQVTGTGEGWPYSCNVEVAYPSERLARIVMATLDVDAELQPDKVKRVLSIKGERLLVSLSATEARFLRASLSAFLDLLGLVSKTVEEFGD